jgi:hypothetical protein
MPTLEASNTTATDGTEQTLSTLTTNKIFQFFIDLNAMAAGDAIEVRLKTKVLNGGTTRVVYKDEFRDEQSADNKIAHSIPVASDQEYVVTLKRIAGTDRSYPWKVLSL